MPDKEKQEKDCKMALGFIGVGNIASAIVTGLRASADSPSSIVLSPRNVNTASSLAARFPGVVVAASNQEVLDRCESVILAIRPQVTESVLRELRFKPSHQVISVVAILSVERIRNLVAPAHRVTRAVPLPSSARCQSPTAIYPANQSVLELFKLVGPAFAVDTEEQFNALCTVTSAVAAYFAFADSIASWLVRRGVPALRARDYIGQVLPSLAEDAAQMPKEGFRAMARAHATPGGLNEQILSHLEAHGLFNAVSDALDQVMQRIIAPL